MSGSFFTKIKKGITENKVYSVVKNFFIKIAGYIKTAITFIKKIIDKVNKKRVEYIKKHYGTDGEILIFKQSFTVYLYKGIALILLFIFIIYFRTKLVLYTQDFFSLFRIKKIFRLDSFNGFVLLKLVNLLTIGLAASVFIYFLIFTTKYFSARFIVSDNEFIFEKGTLLTNTTKRIPIKSVSRITSKAGFLEEIIGTGSLNIFADNGVSCITIKHLKKYKTFSKRLISRIKSDNNESNK